MSSNQKHKFILVTTVTRIAAMMAKENSRLHGLTFIFSNKQKLRYMQHFCFFQIKCPKTKSEDNKLEVELWQEVSQSAWNLYGLKINDGKLLNSTWHQRTISFVNIHVL